MFWKKKQDLIANVDEAKCRNCRYCVQICRHNALTCTVVQGKMTTFVNRPERCSGCAKCAKNCPEQAIEMIERYC
ncbi:MAG: 4Fe-4S binding protein [Dysgonamonadaceae bacterium]|nr:4Fe-4S binding protein [Dysgonamonadaceae bacterium]